jgi:hypothetical protein
MKNPAFFSIMVCFCCLGFAESAINPFTSEGAIALYHCNEGSGTQLQDATSNGHHGTVTNGEWVEGAHDKGISLSGPDGKVDLGDFDIEAAFTIECWVYPATLDGENYIIQKMHGDSSDNYRLAIIDGEITGGIDIVDNGDYFNNLGERRKVSWTLPAANQWYYVALAWQGQIDNGRLRLYVDGELKDHTLAQFFPLKTNDSNAYIGWAESAGSFNGVIDEIKISDDDLDASEILQNYNDATTNVSVRTNVHSANSNLLMNTSIQSYSINGALLPTQSDNGRSFIPTIKIRDKKACLIIRK